MANNRNKKKIYKKVKLKKANLIKRVKAKKRKLKRIKNRQN